MASSSEAKVPENPTDGEEAIRKMSEGGGGVHQWECLYQASACIVTVILVLSLFKKSNSYN